MGVQSLVSFHLHMRMNGAYWGKMAFVEQMDADTLKVRGVEQGGRGGREGEAGRGRQGGREAHGLQGIRDVAGCKGMHRSPVAREEQVTGCRHCKGRSCSASAVLCAPAQLFPSSIQSLTAHRTPAACLVQRWGYQVTPKIGPLWKSLSGEYSNLRWDLPADQIQYYWQQVRRGIAEEFAYKSGGSLAVWCLGLRQLGWQQLAGPS